jgi:transposase-like protein
MDECVPEQWLAVYVHLILCRRRTRVATLFPNDASLLRLVTAVLMEVTEDWETGRRYLSMDAE